MDAQLVMALIGSGSLVVVGVAIGKGLTTRRDISALDHRVHKLSNRLEAYPANPNDVFAHKDVIAAQLGAIQERVNHIGSQVDRLVGRQ